VIRQTEKLTGKMNATSNVNTFRVDQGRTKCCPRKYPTDSCQCSDITNF